MLKIHPLLISILFAAACLSPNSSNKNKELVNVYEGPTTLFHNSCAECHGENGSDYEDDFHHLSDGELAEKIESMMAGPAQIIAPQKEEIDALVQYHRALRDKKLFLMVNNAASILEGLTTLKGSATPGAKVVLQKGETILSAVSQRGEWVLNNIPSPPFILTAEKGGSRTSFQFPDRQFNEI
ncbi:MAG: hypothetical protein JXR73_05060 [Candidatus Omnitrophica bacterium]|nr:hypothetical protein [Candidatus Omnitrophota bacterium]